MVSLYGSRMSKWKKGKVCTRTLATFSRYFGQNHDMTLHSKPRFQPRSNSSGLTAQGHLIDLCPVGQTKEGTWPLYIAQQRTTPQAGFQQSGSSFLFLSFFTFSFGDKFCGTLIYKGS